MEYPDVVPMLTFATDRDARVAVATAFNNRAWPANDDVLVELMALRQEHATLLGYDGWPAYDAEVKMIETGDAIATFVDKISKAAEASALRDRDILLARVRQDRPDAEALDAADSRFYTETIKREQHSVDAQEVRRYFAFDRVRQGLLDVTGRLFGLGYERVDVPTWHADVASYDVSLGGERDRPDPPRPAPARGQVQARGAVHAHRRRDRAPAPRGRAGVQLPARADGARRRRHAVPRVRPPLHHVLGGHQRWARFAGVATEWDFVEAPSQMLEEWAWDAAVLEGFATDEDGQADPGRPGRADARRPTSSARGCTPAPRCSTPRCPTGSTRTRRPTAPAIRRARSGLQAAYSMVAPLPDTHFHAAFGHLDGYSSVYYTYMWSLVIAKDLFSAFDRETCSTPSRRPLPRPDPGARAAARTRRTWSRTSSAGRSASRRSRPGCEESSAAPPS